MYNSNKIVLWAILQILLFVSSSAWSADVINLKGPAPVELLILMIQDFKKLGKCIAFECGAHGLECECFQAGGIFLIFEKNVVGEGYRISQIQPAAVGELQCRTITQQPKNGLGISIGTEKAILESMPGVTIPGPSATLRSTSKKIIKSATFDVQTTANFQFSKFKLIDMRIFTTTTN